MQEKELTVLMPCLNEERTIASCIKSAEKFIQKSGADAEILIADNGSTDSSAKIAEKMGARVISISEKGYGNALRGGIKSAYGKYIIMGDCDESYDFEKLGLFLQNLRAGASFVIGDRFCDIQKGAMPFSHRYFGVPFLSWLGRVKFKCTVHDFHCGLRGINKADFEKLNLSCMGMEFATEMIAKASRAGLKIIEIPVTLRPDGRNGKSHLRTVRDGIRHLVYIMSENNSRKGLYR